MAFAFSSPWQRGWPKTSTKALSVLSVWSKVDRVYYQGLDSFKFLPCAMQLELRFCPDTRLPCPNLWGFLALPTLCNSQAPEPRCGRLSQSWCLILLDLCVSPRTQLGNQLLPLLLWLVLNSAATHTSAAVLSALFTQKKRWRTDSGFQPHKHFLNTGSKTSTERCTNTLARWALSPLPTGKGDREGGD